MQMDEQKIDVWLVFYHDIVNERVVADMRALLSDEERFRETKFHFADDRKRYCVTRAMVRTVLSRYAMVTCTNWEFSTNSYGRPEIASSLQQHQGVAGLSFNISHTHGLIALAVSRHRALGIDVENLRTHEMSIDIAEKFFSPTEIADLRSLPYEERQTRFLEYWTFKEAYIKARGMGLSLPLDRFSFQCPHERAVQIIIDPVLGDDENGWSFWQYQPRTKYLLAICAERLSCNPPIVTTRKIIPTGTEEVLELMLRRASGKLSSRAESTDRSQAGNPQRGPLPSRSA